MEKKITRKECLIAHYNISLKAKVAAEKELAFCEKKDIININPNVIGAGLQERAKEMSGIQKIIDDENKYLEIINEMLEKEND